MNSIFPYNLEGYIVDGFKKTISFILTTLRNLQTYTSYIILQVGL